MHPENAVRLLIDDTLMTATFTTPHSEGWVTPAAGVTVEVQPGLHANQVGAEDVALLPVAEMALLSESHQAAPDAAVITGSLGAIAIRTPVRPDEVPRGPVRLLATSGTAEILARATLRPFFGIEPTGWVRDDDDPAATQAQVVVVEGAEALRPAEGGYSEDLCRAWFILTGLPLVTHLLAVPATAVSETLASALATLAALRQAGLDRRREWRPPLAEREGIPLDRLHTLFAEQRLSSEPDVQTAVQHLLRRGAPGTAYAASAPIRFRDVRSLTET